jgi:hypothetical protein
MKLRQVDSQYKNVVKEYEESELKLRRFVPSRTCTGMTSERRKEVS